MDDKAIEKFQRDVKTLRSMYTDTKLAMLMKTNPGNFSSRVKGYKRPGQDFIDRFYQVWGKRLKEIRGEETDLGGEVVFSAGNEMVEDTGQAYTGHLLSEQVAILHRIEESLSRLNSIIGSQMELVLEINQKLIKKLIDTSPSLLGQQREKSDSQPVEK